MNTGLTYLFCVYVCVQDNPYFIPQKHESNEEEPGIHAMSANAQKEDTVARPEKKEYTNNIFHLLSVKQNTDQGKNLLLKCNLVLV